jgi:NADP-dependent 3-hydroxy acid dehydrogenase YdfG
MALITGARRMDRLEQIRSARIEPSELDVTDENAINHMVNHVPLQ